MGLRFSPLSLGTVAALSANKFPAVTTYTDTCETVANYIETSFLHSSLYGGSGGSLAFLSKKISSDPSQAQVDQHAIIQNSFPLSLVLLKVKGTQTLAIMNEISLPYS